MANSEVPYTAVYQSYQGYESSSSAQYQPPPQPQFAPPLPSSSLTQQTQAIFNIYQHQTAAPGPPSLPPASQYQFNPNTHQQLQPQPPSILPVVQYQPNSNTHQQLQPHPAGYNLFSNSAPQPYRTSFNEYLPPGPTQYHPLSYPQPASHGNYARQEQTPQSGHPPAQWSNAYSLENSMAPVGFAPTSSIQGGAYAAAEPQNSIPPYSGHATAPNISSYSSGNPESLTPLGIAVSIKAILQITGSVFSYLRDVKDGWRHCKKLIIELATTRGTLDTLLDTFQSMEGLGEWVQTIQALGEQQGPLKVLRATLENLLDQLSRSASAPSYFRFTRSLPWPLGPKETDNILKSIETEKSLLLMALQNDILFWAEITVRGSRVVPMKGGDGAPQGPVVRPQTSTHQSQPTMDDLISSFSQAHLNAPPAATIATTITTVLQRLEPAPQDGVEAVIRNVLTPDLATAQANEIIDQNNPCFERSKAFAWKLSLPPSAIDNHIRLACGNRRFPVLMLLNPWPNHDRSNFNEMIQRCPTLKWIQDVLREIGLTLADIIILDICPLLSDQAIKYYERSGEVNEAFDITRWMLEQIKPNIIISCQCNTLKVEKWPSVKSDISWKLCSSIAGAQGGQVIKRDIDGHPIHVVQGYHPSYFLNFSDHFDGSEEVLRRLFFRIYGPCKKATNTHLYYTR